MAEESGGKWSGGGAKVKRKRLAGVSVCDPGGLKFGEEGSASVWGKGDMVGTAASGRKASLRSAAKVSIEEYSFMELGCRDSTVGLTPEDPIVPDLGDVVLAEGGTGAELGSGALLALAADARAHSALVGATERRALVEDEGTPNGADGTMHSPVVGLGPPKEALGDPVRGTPPVCGFAPARSSGEVDPDGSRVRPPLSAPPVGGQGSRTKHDPTGSELHGNAWCTPRYIPFNQDDMVGWDHDTNSSAILHDGDTRNNVYGLDCALAGKIFGKPPQFLVLTNRLHRLWDKFGFFQLVRVRSDVFVAIFDEEEARSQVLGGGPWMIAGIIIGLEEWTPQLPPDYFHSLSSPIWVRLLELPLMYWSRRNIGLIAAKLGKPLGVGHQSGSWGKSSYARVCVRMNLMAPLPVGVWVKGLYGKHYQRVMYEGIPQPCEQCGRIGHSGPECNFLLGQTPAEGHPTHGRGNGVAVPRTDIGGAVGASEPGALPAMKASIHEPGYLVPPRSINLEMLTASEPYTGMGDVGRRRLRSASTPAVGGSTRQDLKRPRVPKPSSNEPSSSKRRALPARQDAVEVAPPG